MPDLDQIYSATELTTAEAISAAVTFLGKDGSWVSDELCAAIVKKLTTLQALLAAMPWSPDDV